jgi:glycosyltransferase involved in cell wall biosynthesis
MNIGYLLQSGVPDVRSSPLSGPANHVKYVIKELRTLGHRVRLLACLDGRIWRSDDFQSFEPVVLRPFKLRSVLLFESVLRRIQSELQLPYAALFESLRFAQACQQELAGCDLLFERMGWMGYAGALSSRMMKKPLVLEINGDHLAEMELLGIAPQGLQRTLSARLTRFAAQQAIHSVATGEAWRRSFIQRWGVAPDKVSVIENGSELVELLDRDELRSFSHDENSSRAIKVAYVGSFDPWQGIHVLLRAAERAVAQNLDIQLYLIGDCPVDNGIREVVRSSGLEERVIFTGRVCTAELAEYLKDVEIGVSPYCGRDEYSGLKLLDYKAAGLATIASGESGEPKVIEHGRTGLIVPPCNEIALCEALTLLVTNGGLRRRLGQTARIEAETEHSWHNTAVQLCEVFERILS